MRIKLSIILILFFLISGCTNKSVPQEKFTSDEQVAYNFLINMYSNNKSRINLAIEKWVFRNKNNIWIMTDKFSKGEFSIPHFQRVEILKSTRIIDYDRHVNLVLVKIYGRKISHGKVLSDVVQTNVVYMVNHKVFLNLMPNDSADKQDLNRLMDSF